MENQFDFQAINDKVRKWRKVNWPNIKVSKVRYGKLPEFTETNGKSYFPPEFYLKLKLSCENLTEQLIVENIIMLETKLFLKLKEIDTANDRLWNMTNRGPYQSMERDNFLVIFALVSLSSSNRCIQSAAA